jgi:hypothetical protein
MWNLKSGSGGAGLGFGLGHVWDKIRNGILLGNPLRVGPCYSPRTNSQLPLCFSGPRAASILCPSQYGIQSKKVVTTQEEKPEFDSLL